MQIAPLSTAYLPPGPAAGRQGRVQPVSPSAGYGAAGDSARGAREVEGEFLRRQGRVQAAAAPRPVLRGTLVNAGRAISAYSGVANATAPDGERSRRRLDLRV